MTVDIFPAGINSQGNNTWWVTHTSPLNDDKSGILIASITASAALDITCYLQAEDQEIGFDQEREDDTRACDETKREEFAAAAFTRDSIVHIVDPQGAATEPGNMAQGAVIPNSTIFVTVRMAVKSGSAPAADQLADVYMVTTGEEHITPRASGKYRREVKTSWTRIAKGVPFITGP